MRLVSACLVLLAAVLTGCTTTTHVVFESDPGGVAVAHAAMVGQTADVDLVSGERTRGRIEFVRVDSVAWTDADALWTVPTVGVAALTADSRWRSVRRGALIGSGAAFGLCFLGGTGLASGFDADGDDALGFGVAIGLACVPSGALYGAIGGSLVGKRVQVVFVAPPPASSGAPAPALR